VTVAARLKMKRTRKLSNSLIFHRIIYLKIFALVISRQLIQRFTTESLLSYTAKHGDSSGKLTISIEFRLGEAAFSEAKLTP
jgi:hypothetical protein